MTVASETSKVQYNGDGATTDFSVTFKYTAKAQIVVVHADSDGVETTWVLGTQYTLTDPGASGTLTVIDTPTDYTPASGETLTIYRDPDFTQDSDYTTGGGLTAEGVESDHDLRVFQIQRLREMLSRAILFKQSTGESDLTLPELVAGKGLAVNDDGDALEWADIKEIFVQNSAPSTSEPSGSLWIDADSTDLDLYQLVSGSWSDTGVNLKGATGATGSTGAAGADGVNAGLTYAFNSGTSGDPGSGQFLANNASLASATALNISDTDGDSNDVSAWLATWDDSDHSIRGTIAIRDQSDTAAFAVFDITGASTDNSTYWTFAVTHVASAGTLSGNCSVQFTRSGDDGADGAGSGDVSGPASSVDGNLPSFSGTGGKTLQDSGIAAANVLVDADIGVSVQAYDAQLDSLSSATANGVSLVTAADYAAMRGLLDLEPNTDFYAPSGTDVAVADGGTGRSSHTAYAVLCGGTTGTAAQQSIASVGTANQVLTSNGAGALPTFQDAAGGGGSQDFQRFDSSGTWTKPAGAEFGANSIVLIQAWGAGGSGGRHTSGGGGGGGGGYAEIYKLLSQLGSTETVTIGAGGAAQTSQNPGAVGGNTTFGSLLTAYGGGGGGGGTAGGGGGGGGTLGVGTNASSGTGGDGGRPASGTGGSAAVGGDSSFGGGGGGGGGGTGFNGGWSSHGGGGGGGADTNGTGGNGGNSVNGGGGGGAGVGVGTPGTGGTSVIGGAGGAGAVDANAATAGTQPGGGGGGADSGDSGAGGDGRVDVIVFPVA